MNKKRYHQTGIRIEDDMYQELRQRAHKNWRTISSEINACIGEGLKKTSPEELNQRLEVITMSLAKVLALLEKGVK